MTRRAWLGLIAFFVCLYLGWTLVASLEVGYEFRVVAAFACFFGSIATATWIAEGRV